MQGLMFGMTQMVTKITTCPRTTVWQSVQLIQVSDQLCLPFFKISNSTSRQYTGHDK